MTACDYLDRAAIAADPAAALADPHVAGCPICRRTAAALAWIADAVPRLAADDAPPPGWEARVLAAIRASDGAAPLTLTVEVEPRPIATRGGASIGDVVRVEGAGGGRHRALWVFRDGSRVELACPAPDAGPAELGADDCRVRDGCIVVTFSPRVAGRFAIVLLASEAPIPAPVGSLVASVAAALRAGADHRVDHLIVR
jgi:hypothetical protein